MAWEAFLQIIGVPSPTRGFLPRRSDPQATADETDLWQGTRVGPGFRCSAGTCVGDSIKDGQVDGGPVVRTPRFLCRGPGFNP